MVERRCDRACGGRGFRLCQQNVDVALMTRDIGHVISFLVGVRRTDQKAKFLAKNWAEEGVGMPYMFRITVEL